MSVTGSLCELRNQVLDPITDPYYAEALALRAHISSYDYIVSQPSVIDETTWARMQEIMRQPGKPLTAKPLPLQTQRGFWRSLWIVVRGRRLYA